MSSYDPDALRDAELDRLRGQVADLQYELAVARGCINSCARKYPHEATQWCAACKDHLIAWDDHQCQLYRQAIRARKIDEWVPATEEEARRELDRIAPLMGS